MDDVQTVLQRELNVPGMTASRQSTKGQLLSSHSSNLHGEAYGHTGALQRNQGYRGQIADLDKDGKIIGTKKGTYEDWARQSADIKKTQKEFSLSSQGLEQQNARYKPNFGKKDSTPGTTPPPSVTEEGNMDKTKRFFNEN